MQIDKIDNFIKTLSELSTFLVEIKHRSIYGGEDNRISEAVERYLDGFNFKPKSVKDFGADAADNVALKLNKNPQCWTAEEVEKMPLLKNLKYRFINGVHQFRYRRNGYDVQFSSKSFEKAKKKARKFIESLKESIRMDSPVRNENCVDFVAQAWLNLKKAHSDEKTWKAYVGVYRNHIKPRFGHRAVKAILPMHLQPFFDELHESKGRTCENAKVILNGVFKYAIANRLCQVNPIDGVVVERHCRTPGSPLTDDQLERFKKKMPFEGKYGLAGIIMLYTGVRGEEFHTIQFDWQQGTFTCKNAKLKKSQRLNPKNLFRTVPILPGLWKYRERIELEDWRISPTRLTNRFKEHWPENTPRQLRHTFSSKAREAGVENELVNIWMGHTPGNNLTANVYTHFSMEFQIKEAQKVQNY